MKNKYYLNSNYYYQEYDNESGHTQHSVSVKIQDDKNIDMEI